jgi:hypothetical protein
VGEEITHPLAKATGQARLRRQAAQAPAPVVPDGKPAPAGGVQQWDDPIVLNAQPAGGAGAVTFTPRRPGVYELAFEGDTARFAVNLDPAEADLRPMDTRLLLSAVQKGPAPAEAAGHGAVSVVTRATLLERAEARQKAWRYLLLAVVGLLVVEMLLARRIGRA